VTAPARGAACHPYSRRRVGAGTITARARNSDPENGRERARGWRGRQRGGPRRHDIVRRRHHREMSGRPERRGRGPRHTERLRGARRRQHRRVLAVVLRSVHTCCGHKGRRGLGFGTRGVGSVVARRSGRGGRNHLVGSRLSSLAGRQGARQVAHHRRHGQPEHHQQQHQPRRDAPTTHHSQYRHRVPCPGCGCAAVAGLFGRRRLSPIPANRWRARPVAGSRSCRYPVPGTRYPARPTESESTRRGTPPPRRGR
jgi:hypothetical protein